MHLAVQHSSGRRVKGYEGCLAPPCHNPDPQSAHLFFCFRYYLPTMVQRGSAPLAYTACTTSALRRFGPSSCIKSQDTEHAHQTGLQTAANNTTCDCLVLECPAPCTPHYHESQLFDSKHERHAAYTLQPSHNPSGWLQTRRYTRKAQVIRTQKRRCTVGLSPLPSSIYHHTLCYPLSLLPPAATRQDG